jgi:crotonobetainyl-CoA:carnitine CoA-transferase CaiB-like acyl-CoA transferase
MSEANILDGVRVLDFSRYIAGPYCAALLGYLGADVIRIEKTGGSEDRFVVPLGGDGGALFAQSAGNKRSLCLNLKDPRAQGVIRRLVEAADVVIVNHPPAGLRELGLDYDTLKAIKPDIILTTQTAYGHTGPWADRGGFDGIGQVMSGATYFSGTDGSPTKSAVPYVDFGTGLYSAFGTLAALYQKRETGAGQHVQASLLGTAMAFFSPILIEQAAVAPNRVGSGNRSQTSAPSDVFATTDGHVLLHVVGNGIFRRLARVLDRDDWITDAALQSDEARGDARDRVCEAVAQWCATRSTDEILDKMAALGVPCGPVLKPAEALVHPQTAAMEFFTRIPMPGLTEGATVADFPVAMSGADVGLHAGTPGTGEHSGEVLAEHGYSAEEIATFRRDGVI